MKILDRYIVGSFLRNYLISFFVLVGMYVVLDMVFKFDELVEIREQVGARGLRLVLLFVRYVGDYYLFQVPLYFAHLSGIIPVVATAFTLVRMTRFNELAAALSVGVPLLRIAMPIILAAVLLQGLLWVDQELIIPNIIPKLIRSPDRLIDTDAKSFSIQAMRDEANGKLFVGRYHPSADPPRMEIFDVVIQDSEFRPVAHIRADGAVWDASREAWRLTNGLICRNLVPDSSRSPASEPILYYKSDITPTEIQLFRSGEFVELLSTRRINELLHRPLSYGRSDLLRVKHARIAQILINVVLLLLASACLLTREPRHLRFGIARCILWCGACLSLAMIGQELAAQPPWFVSETYWPALMAWLPIFVFAPIAVWLLDRVKT